MKCADCDESARDGSLRGEDGRPLCGLCALDDATLIEQERAMLRLESVVPLEAYRAGRSD